MLDHLLRTKPSVDFIGVLGILGALIMLFLGVVVVTESDIGEPQRSTVAGLYVIESIVVFISARFISQYGTAIGKIKVEGARALERALDRQRLFWRFSALLTLLSLLLILLLVLLAFGARLGIL